MGLLGCGFDANSDRRKHSTLAHVAVDEAKRRMGTVVNGGKECIPKDPYLAGR
jgi:hypothetical protein